MNLSTSSRLLIFLLLTTLTATLSGQTLILDEFDGTGLINQKDWRLANGGPGSFFGRTQLKTNLATDYPQLSGSGFATLQIDTYLDNGMGASSGVFSGAEINTKRNFARAGGLRFESRARIVNPPPGVVGGQFLFDVTREIPATPDCPAACLVRDEIDHEMLSNEAQPGGQGRAFTNFWNEGPFVGPGSGGAPQFHSPPSYDMTQFNDYRVDWLPNRIDWYINDTLVRTQTTDVPDDPMNFRVNYWVPDAGFTQAYSALLQPAATMGENQTFDLDLDRVEITRLNTTVGENLILDPSFEDPAIPFIPADGTDNDLGAWYWFNNASINSEIAARTGDFTLKTYGPFFGSPDASGVFQNVEAQEGDVFEASAFAQTIMTDSIQGTANFTEIAIDFLDAGGNNLGNNKSSVIMEGRDPNTPVDEWVQGIVDAVAPAGTAQARLSLFFIQLENQGGAVWFDDVSLNRLFADMPPVADCDFDGNGLCDIDDVDELTMATSTMSSDLTYDLNGDGSVNEADIAEWLVQAGADPGNEALTGGNPFLNGDANLDGVVDGQDFVFWNQSKFQPTAAYSQADFNGDGVTDGQDFVAWNDNKFQSSIGGFAAVPEPSSALLLLVGFLGLLVCRGRAVR